MNDETRRYLDAHTDPAKVKALWSWVDGGPHPCPICGEAGGFHSDDKGHRHARDAIPSKLIRKKGEGR